MMGKFRNMSFKNKIFLSTSAVILLLSAAIALDTRVVLVSGLTSELEQRGISIARSVADRGRSYILTEDKPHLVSLVFDAAQLEERRKLVSYIFILNAGNQVLSHTFMHPFPDELRLANTVPPQKFHQIRLLQVKNSAAYDIAVPVLEGIYRIGTVHVGLSKKHIDRLVGKLRMTYLGIIVAIFALFFLISHWLSTYITRPISELTQISDEISRGNLDVASDLGSNVKCWEVMKCEKDNCPAYGLTDFPCWYVDETQCAAAPPCKFPEKLRYCIDCSLFKRRGKDEVRQLADSFLHMTNRLKVSQEQLKQSEEKYRSHFVSGPNPVFVVDSETLEILEVNPTAENTYGYSKEELIGKSFTDLGLFEDEKTGLSFFAGDTHKHLSLISSKVRHHKKGGKPIYVNVHARPVRYQNRDAIIVATTDITEMVEKDALLVQASKMTMLGQMSAGVAHELNQPLNAIKMGSEYVKMMAEKGREISDTDALTVISEISSQVDRASEIINRLREFGRKADLQKKKMDIKESIRNVLAIIGRQLKLQNIEITLNLANTPLPILGYKNRIEQILFNLLTNAQDAIIQKRYDRTESSPPTISISSFKDDHSVVVAVSDNGVGMPQSIYERIFEPFFTTKEVGKGMGLGLSIAYGIVKDCDGEIHVDSEEGVGTTFKLVFPLASA